MNCLPEYERTTPRGKELTGFNERLQEIAQRHAIEPAKLGRRLLQELETLDRGLALETVTQNRQQEMDKMEQAIDRNKSEIETTRAVVNTLKHKRKQI